MPALRDSRLVWVAMSVIILTLPPILEMASFVALILSVMASIAFEDFTEDLAALSMHSRAALLASVIAPELLLRLSTFWTACSITLPIPVTVSLMLLTFPAIVSVVWARACMDSAIWLEA